MATAKTSKTKLKSYPLYDWQNQTPPVVGVDEAGRGCLAGPVCAAAVVFKPSADPTLFTDSKLLSAKRRDELYDIIFAQAHVGVGFASVQEIDEINILKASLLAMKRAVENLKQTPGILLVDGNFKVPGLHVPQVALIKGELRASPIAAASIIAKVSRDRLMDQLHEELPDYGFLQHKGYGTELHREAIQKLGPTRHHRLTFAGVKEHVRSSSPKSATQRSSSSSPL